MKQIIGVLLLVLTMSACNKSNLGTMKYKARFCTSDVKSNERKTNESYHTIFGDYICSVTPTQFSMNLQMFVFQDYYSDQDPGCHMISFVQNQGTWIDLSGNTELEFSPQLFSTDIRDGLFEQKEIDFRFISFVPENFNHQFEIPIQYLNTINNLNQNDGMWGSEYVYDPISNKITVNSTKHFSYGAIHGNGNAMPTGYMVIFGETDSSYVYMYEGVNLTESERFPFWDSQNRVIIRSKNFQTQNIIMPDADETFTMYATLSYDINGMIQIYAGNDNIPYTSDDVLVYPPNFWDRINIRLEMRYN